MEVILSINSLINGFVWGPVMLVLLVGTGIYLTVRTNFFQFKKSKTILKETIGNISQNDIETTKKGSISPFAAMTTAIASTVGVGNIAGVATAIVAGGPGAIFWMWISALFGMMTKYGEILLSVKYRQKDVHGAYYGGPMYYIEKGLNKKWLAVTFCVFGTMACFGIGNMTQSNEIAAALKNTLGFSPLFSGVLIAIVVALVIVGGISRIGKVTKKVVPFMAAFYILGGVLALIANASEIPKAFEMIFHYAFSFESAGGGVMGYMIARAITFGFARGVFSNEAGLGSAPIVHAAANTKSPVKQGMWGIFEVFIDTIIICTITALVILTSGLVSVEGTNVITPASGGALTSLAYAEVFGSFGELFISIAIIFFAISTILGWSYYGERCIAYILKDNKKVISVFKTIFICFIVVGAVGQLQVVWAISDTLNGMMAIPNLIGIIALSGIIIKTTKDYIKDPKSVEMND